MKFCPNCGARLTAAVAPAIATSEAYFLEQVLPILRKSLRQALKGHKDYSLRGQGTVNRKQGSVEFIIDGPNVYRPGMNDTIPLILDVAGSYMYANDGEYDVYMRWPGRPGTHQVHDRFTHDPAKDAKEIVDNILPMLDDMWNGLQR